MSVINYHQMIQDAFLKIMQDTLKILDENIQNDIISQNQLYLVLNTKHPDLVIPDYLREQAPETLTLVFQYEFFNLEILDDCFKVSLDFNNVLENLVIPYAAINEMFDPMGEMYFKFQHEKDEDAAQKAEENSTNNKPKRKPKMTVID